MEIVVLSSDIARLVLDYLKSQNLKRAHHIFCKTSPYLKQEFSAYKHGLQTHSFYPELEEIICEYVKITRKVDQEAAKQNNEFRFEFQRLKLSEKVCKLLDRECQHEQITEGDTATDLQTATAGPNTSNSINSDKENNNIGRKRKRTCDTNQSNNDENVDSKTKGSPSSRLGNYAKKRKMVEPYCFLSSKSLQRHRRRKQFLRLSPCTAAKKIDAKYGKDEDDEEWSSSSYEDITTESDDETEEIGDDDLNGNDLFNGAKPTKESTPRSRSQDRDKLRGPILPEISQAILENPEFQQKLVENINQALNNSSAKAEQTKSLPTTKPQTSVPISNEITNDEIGISSSQLLDQMIKNILDVTEKDPSFDAIIHEVVEASNKPIVQSAGVQCDLGPTNAEFLGRTDGRRPVFTSTEPPPLVPTRPQSAVVQPRVQMQSADIVNNTSQTIEIPPRTPLIIRNAVAAANASTLGASSAQDPPTITANNSFGSLIDPNFSISKLIVLNSNDSAQKQHPEPSIGNITAENIINQLSTSGVVAETGDEQVYFDATTGQLTLPLYLTNDGLLANFPFLINNEIVTQQLQPGNIANMDASRIEIPLPEPIVVTADQLPPNSIILGSSQKMNPAENNQASHQTIEKAAAVVGHKDIITCNTGPPGSLDTRLMAEKATPSTSGIVNTKAYRSLSTPRKRASHVRTLTFSPRGPQFTAATGAGATPLSTRRETLSRAVQRSVPKPIPEEAISAEVLSASEKPIIKNVEILPAISTNDSNVKDSTSVSANESANNCSVPHLFVTEESSNQTVINKHSSSSVKAQQVSEPTITDACKNQITNAPENTPKRKQTRQNAVRACKRQLSKSQNEDDISAEKNEKENEINAPPPGSEEYEMFMLQEWMKARNSSNIDLDVRLRELNSKMTVLKPVKKVNTKKRIRRKKPAATKRKEKEMAEEAEELEMSRELLNESQEANVTGAADSVPEHPSTCPDSRGIEVAAMACDKVEKENNAAMDNIEEVTPSRRGGKKAKDIAIKIPTPQKTSITTKEKNSKIKENKKENPKKVYGNRARNENSIQPDMVEPSSNAAHVESAEELKPNDFPVPVGGAPHTQAIHATHTICHVNEVLEREKRTSNIAFLLETPYKDPNISNFSSTGIPPTPGIFAPSLETPAGKNKNPQDEMVASTSFLFGSLTKSELDTPMLSALTPGFRFTPFGMKEIATPRSVTGTEYSSGGGSYYKPDESEDLDRNIDKILRDSAQKALQQERNDETDRTEDDDDEREEGEIRSPTKPESEEDNNQEIEVEIPVEKLKVEPIVLKRVKSFGCEAVDSIETAKIDPHYTLASGLPEISAAEDSNSTSSSSSSSGSSSSSNSSNSTRSSASKSSTKSKTVLEVKTPKKLSDLDNLSEISSTEDEEWKKCVVSDNNENSQLVNIDGEVRYPVRSWLTPVKENVPVEDSLAVPPVSGTSANLSTIKVTLPLKSAEKRIRQVKELEMKRERMKEKLKRDASSIIGHEKPTSCSSSAPNISAALAASRVIHAMRDKGRRPACFEVTQTTVTTTAIDEKRSIDVLTALRLSAKKHPPKTPETEKPKIQCKLEASIIADDNAIVQTTTEQKTIIPKTPENKENPKMNISSASGRTPQRKCLPIDARPVTKTIRKANKNIVRTPLAFKTVHSPGKINSHSTTTTLAELSHKSKDSPISPTIATVKVSPSLTKPKKTRTKKTQESKAVKAKTSPKATKAKAAPKSKVARAPTKKKTVSKKIEKENIVLDPRSEGELNERKEDSMEETSQQASSIKPKIHIKAANAMLQTKQSKNNRSADDNVAEKELDEAQDVEKVKSHSPSKNLKPSVEPNIDQENVEETSEEDPFDSCDICTIDETDTKHFVHCTYQGPDEPPPPSDSPNGLCSFQMFVAIDENNKHVWSVSEGITLYSCPPVNRTLSTAKSVPQPVRNIPKKRKVRITSTADEKTVPAAVPNTKIAAVSLKAFTTAATPGATSTPVQTAGVVSRTEKAVSKEGSKSKAMNNVKSSVKTSDERLARQKNVDEANNENEKLQIEDIESILSHLHGT
ncbi:multi sex combs [Haematobia irritans]|uniref:multi sex combs n=1 Tax=Haematobia irritans TaxID=7368 RepID=UPI003F503B69